jgi:asparagine synthase (glutamine-hydrolysing)
MRVIGGARTPVASLLRRASARVSTGRDCGDCVCGIAGAVGRHGADRTLLDAMRRCIEHRGPDGSGTWIDPSGGAGLAHQRLAVLGLGPEGAQPMASSSGRYLLVHNGEIYNHLELREQLHAAGHAPAWRGASDTETLLAAIDAWGIDRLLPRTVGMFALALWDRERRILTLARDRLGEKPLSYVVHDGTLAFASQPSALLRLPGHRPDIDPDALASLLRHGHVTGARGIHRGIRKLAPGTLLRVDPTDPTAAEPETWWSFADVAAAGVADPLPGEGPAIVDTIDAVEAVVRAAVRSQRISDVPLGAFLSGGVDSSLVVALLQAESSRRVQTFTIGFREDSHDEAPHARAVADHLATDHTELLLSERDALDLVPDLPGVYDEPFADTSQLPTLLVSRLARGSVTVALSGDGGDELFGGYTRYRQLERFAAWPRAVPLAGAVIGALSGHHRRRDLSLAVLRGPAATYRALLSVDDLRTERLVPSASGGGAEAAARAWDAAVGLGGVTARAMALDTVGELPDGILHKVDRASMSVALETRLPLLDHRVVATAWRVPPELRVRDGVGKWVLRQVLDRYVPPALTQRPKQGFSAPVGRWLRGSLRPWAEDLLSPASVAADGLLDVAAVRSLWQQHLAGRSDHGSTLWPILMFLAWQASPASRGIEEVRA